MVWLILVSFVWAFSFGLVKRLAGLDPTAVAFLRMVIAMLVFIPFLRVRSLAFPDAARLALVGAVQFGLMYILYLRAYAHLQAYEIALFTIFTPLYLTAFAAIAERKWNPRFVSGAVLAVVGAAIALWQRSPDRAVVEGFVLVQGSNLCFAAGQLFYRRMRKRLPASLKDHHVFAWLCLGAVLATAATSGVVTEWNAFRPTREQWLVLIYLGAIASGVGFFLWNVGATQVNAGLLAVFNNAKIPLGIACSLLFFGEQANPIRLGLSLCTLICAVIIVGKQPTPAAS